MPKREDIKSILLIGSGPFVIGQVCGVRLFRNSSYKKRFKELGYRVVLINSNPATIMTDPEFADKTYIEQSQKKLLQKRKKENIDAILPTMGGQTALMLQLQCMKKVCF